MATEIKYGLNDAAKRYVLAVTGKTAEELSAFNPEDEVALATEANGAAPVWSREPKGAFRGRGHINIANRRIKTLDKYAAFLNDLVKNGARQY